MLDLLPSPGPDVVAFRVSGKVSKADVELAWASLDAALDEAETIGLYAEIVDLGGFTIDGLVEDVAHALKEIGQWRRFARYAVVTDAGWLRTLADVEGKLLPGIEIRTYAMDQKDDAMAWLSAHTRPQTSAPAGPERNA